MCSTDDHTFTPAPTRFKAREGKWIGAKYGIYSLSPEPVRKGWCEMTGVIASLRELTFDGGQK